MDMIKNLLKKFFDNKKNRFLFVGLLVFLVLIIIVLVVFNKGNYGLISTDVSDSKKFKNEYEDLNDEIVVGDKKYPKVKLPDNDIIKYSTIDNVIDIFNNNKDGVVYFGYSTCLYCRNAVQILLDTAVDTELDELLYIDIEDYWDVKELDENGKVITKKEAHSRYYELLDVLGDELITDYVLEDENGEDVKTGVKRIRYPLVLFVTDGNVASYHIGTLFFQKDPFVSMDDSQIKGLSGIYRSGIRDVVSSKKNKGLLK